MHLFSTLFDILLYLFMLFLTVGASITSGVAVKFGFLIPLQEL
jgi:hypothetical protein